MSFRTRLTGFFVLIVVVPMIGFGILVFSLINDSDQGKANVRASTLATEAGTVYQSAMSTARQDAATIAREAATASRSALPAMLTKLATESGLARVTVKSGSTTVADVGDRTAIAPGYAVAAPPGRPPVSVAASELTASDLAQELAGSDVQVVVRQGGSTLTETIPATAGRPFPAQGTVSVGGISYREVTRQFPGFGGGSVGVTVLSDLSATASSVQASRLVAAVFIAAFLLLAFSFSVLASRALSGQIGRFLQAARRLGSGDFSSPVPIEGRDEFAELGDEFNSMSSQLASRLGELRQERARLRDAIHRIGQTFASNLDRPALLELALSTAVDAAQANSGRVSARLSVAEPLEQTGLVGSLTGLEQVVYEAERDAISSGGLGEASSDGAFAAAVPLGPMDNGTRAHGLLTVARRGRAFTDDDRDVLRSLGSQAALALENVDLHFQVRRQAVTDELTGLANHGRFQEQLGNEIEQVRRYRHPVGLIMLDIDNFKSINDTYGHPQGDVVLKHVARVVRESSRETDTPARYGGEEMTLILSHTDLEGSYAIAERVRTAIESLRIPRLDQQGALRITASLGVAASTEGDKDGLIAAADAALYTAKRQGKNRTIRAPVQSANVVGGE